MISRIYLLHQTAFEAAWALANVSTRPKDIIEACVEMTLLIPCLLLTPGA